MSFMVTLLSRDKEQAELLAAGIELTAKLTQRYLAVESTYLVQLDDAFAVLPRRILILYKLLLTFQISAVVHLGCNTLISTSQNLFSTSSWTDLISIINTADADCEAERRLVDSAHGIQSATKLQAILQQCNDGLLQEWRSYRKLQEDWYTSERASRCMATLRTVDYNSYKNQNPQHAAGTCRWLTDHQKFKHWMAETKFACLWVTAAPGCGKSTYARYLVDEYLPTNASDSTTCFFFFFKDESKATKSCNAISSILHQLFSRPGTRCLLHHIESVYAANLEKTAELFDDLWTTIVAIARDHCAGKLIILLDGLDECSDVDRKTIVSRIAELANNDAADTLKTLITGRPNSPVEALAHIFSTHQNDCCPPYGRYWERIIRHST